MKFSIKAIKAKNILCSIVLRLVLFTLAVNQVQAQTNCPSGIVIDVSSGNNMIAIWSPLSNGDYRVTRGNNIGTHTGKDIYALDLSIPGSADRGKGVYLPITGRIWSVRTTGGYGNTTFIWDPGTGILIRLAHLLDFSSVLNGANGNWFGAGTKAGYIGETGCPGCGEHLHLVAYRNVRVGVNGVSEQTIINDLSVGRTPAIAQPQKYRLIAPSDNCDLLRFDDNPTVYTNKNQTLYGVTPDVWNSWGLSLNLTPQEGTYDQVAGRIPVRILPASQRGSFSISSLAQPRNESVIRGNQSSAVYLFRAGRKSWLNASQFCDDPRCEFRFSEVQVMDQNFVNQLP